MPETESFSQKARIWRDRRAVHDLVKCLETYVGGNVKVSEWPIQCTVASDRETGPRDLSLYLFGTFAALTSAGQRRGRRSETTAACFPRSVDLLLLSRHRSVSTGKRKHDGRERREVHPPTFRVTKRCIRTKKSDKSISKSVTFRIRRFSSFMLIAFLSDCSLYLSHFILLLAQSNTALKIIRCDQRVIKRKEKKRIYPILIASSSFLFQVSKSAKFNILTSYYVKISVSKFINK